MELVVRLNMEDEFLGLVVGSDQFESDWRFLREVGWWLRWSC